MWVGMTTCRLRLEGVNSEPVQVILTGNSTGQELWPCQDRVMHSAIKWLIPAGQLE